MQVFRTLLNFSTVYLYMHLVRYGFGIHFSPCCLKGSPRISFPVLYNRNHRGEREKETEQNRACREESREQKQSNEMTSWRAKVWSRQRQRCGSVKKGDGATLAMLMPHYSTAEFVKRRCYSHPRPYISGVMQWDQYCSSHVQVASNVSLVCVCAFTIGKREFMSM